MCAVNNTMESVYVVVGTLSMHIQLNGDPESITRKVIWSFEVSREFEFLEVFSSFLSTRKKNLRDDVCRVRLWLSDATSPPVWWLIVMSYRLMTRM